MKRVIVTTNRKTGCGLGAGPAGREFVFAIGGLALGIVMGCQMLPDGAPFYRGNPYEGAECDGELPGGTSVLVLGQEREYARVWADNGEIAYIFSKYLITMEEWDRIQAARESAAKVMDQTSVSEVNERQSGAVYENE
jgi:hypothetical protein